MANPDNAGLLHWDSVLFRPTLCCTKKPAYYTALYRPLNHEPHPPPPKKKDAKLSKSKSNPTVSANCVVLLGPLSNVSKVLKSA